MISSSMNKHLRRNTCLLTGMALARFVNNLIPIPSVLHVLEIGATSYQRVARSTSRVEQSFLLMISPDLHGSAPPNYLEP